MTARALPQLPRRFPTLPHTPRALSWPWWSCVPCRPVPLPQPYHRHLHHQRPVVPPAAPGRAYRNLAMADNQQQPQQAQQPPPPPSAPSGPRKLADGNVVYVLDVPGTPEVVVTIESAAFSTRLERGKDEGVGVTLRRVGIKFQKDLEKARGKNKDRKKSKPKKGERPPPLAPTARAELSDAHAAPIPDHTTNADAWKRAASLLLVLPAPPPEDPQQREQAPEQEQDVCVLLPVVYNPPHVQAMRLGSQVGLTGIAQRPQVELLNATDRARWQWARQVGDDAWEVVGDDAEYEPTDADVGHVLECRCFPVNDTVQGLAALVRTQPVRAAPPPMVPPRPRPASPAFRVVSYNVLADAYASTEHSKQAIFAHCDPPVLDIHYRAQLVSRELLNANADVVCLQECDERWFQQLYAPVMEAAGFAAWYTHKAGKVAEGCATFVRSSVFEVVEQRVLNLKQLLAASSPLQSLLDHHPSLKQASRNIGPVVQLSVLRLRAQPSQALLVCNTHFYYHPLAAHVRLMHAAVALDEVERVQAELRERDGREGGRVPLVFCGDFNSTPQSVCAEFLFQGRVAATHPAWNYLDHFTWGDKSFRDVDLPQSPHALVEHIPDLSHPYALRSALGVPEFTNHAVGFVETVDYIFVDSELVDVQGTFSLPSRAEVEAYTSLPSPLFPSDHLPLIADLCFKQ